MASVSPPAQNRAATSPVDPRRSKERGRTRLRRDNRTHHLPPWHPSPPQRKIVQRLLPSTPGAPRNVAALVSAAIIEHIRSDHGIRLPPSAKSCSDFSRRPPALQGTWPHSSPPR